MFIKATDAYAVEPDRQTLRLPRPPNLLADQLDVLRHVVDFARGDGYIYVAGVSKLWRDAWGDLPPETNVSAAVQSSTCVEWAKAAGCPWGPLLCSRAAAGGHFDALRWARGAGCEWDARTCFSAAFGGYLEMLQWCRANGCPWDSSTCADAAEGGHLEVRFSWRGKNVSDVVFRFV